MRYSRKKRWKVFWLGIILVIMLLILCFLFFSFSLNNYREVLEAELTEMIEAPVFIKGDIKAKILPSFGVVIKDVSLADNDGLIIDIPRLELKIPLGSFFSNNIQIVGLRVQDPSITIVNKSIDITSIELPAKKDDVWVARSDSLDWQIDLLDVIISNGSFHYYDENTLDTIQFEGIHLSSDSILAVGNADSLIFEDVTAYGQLSIDMMQVNSFLQNDAGLDVEIQKGIISISYYSKDSSGGIYNGALQIDLSGEVPDYKVSQEISNFRLEDFTSQFSDDGAMRGEMDFSLNLHFRGKTSSELWNSSKGEINLKGNDLFIYGVNIDKVADKFLQSQKFNLVDVGALFLAGPVGIAVTKGYDYADLLLANKGDTTHIRELISNWELQSGMLYAKDVAFSTPTNRIALKGGLDIRYEMFDSLEFALVNNYGCAIFLQRLDGSFNNPEASKVKVVKTVLAPIKNLFTGKKCKYPFYEGSIVSPD